MHAHDGRDDSARFAALGLAGATLALATSLWVEDEIGGAVLYGAFAALLAGALVDFVLASVGPGAIARLRSRAGAILGGVRIETALRRESDSRLRGALVVANRSQRPVRIVGIGVDGPEGARVAVRDDAGEDAVTMRFDGDFAPAAIRLRAGESRTRRFHVLLPAGATTARRLRLHVDLEQAGATRRRRIAPRVPT